MIRGTPNRPRYTMIIELDRCVGCDACIVACKSENAAPGGLVYDPVRPFETQFNGVAKTMFLPLLCMHCDDAPCIKACPSRALRKRDDGIVIVNEDLCCGFRACVTACPYGAIQVPKEHEIFGSGRFTPLDRYALSRHSLNVAQKCNLCSHRIDAGRLQPACVEVCPTECRIFGDANDPDGPIAKLLEKGPAIKLRLDAKSKPSVSYILPMATRGGMTGEVPR